MSRRGLRAALPSPTRSTHDDGRKRYWTTSAVDPRDTAGVQVLLVDPPRSGEPWPLSEPVMAVAAIGGVAGTDDEIAAAVLDRLAWNVMIARNAIKVKVEKGFVILTGEVEWHYRQEAAKPDVQHLHGVVGVANNVTVMARAVDVGEISTNIQRTLKRSWHTRPGSISVTANHGKVELTGFVHSPHARHVATEAAWNAPGPTAVENDLVISWTPGLRRLHAGPAERRSRRNANRGKSGDTCGHSAKQRVRDT